jgi:hypothetical protein
MVQPHRGSIAGFGDRLGCNQIATSTLKTEVKMTTTTKEVRGRKSKQMAPGIVINTSPAGRLELDLYDMREAYKSLERIIQEKVHLIAETEKDVANQRRQLADMGHEIGEIEAAIRVLNDHAV